MFSYKFIYVFNKQDRDTLCNLGFTILNDDIERNIFVFINDEAKFTSIPEMSYALTNTLSF